MSIRLSIITTRTGDAGVTGLADGSRLDKDAPRIVALGDVDELNSVIGLWRTESLPDGLDDMLGDIQNDLFDLGAELCWPGHAAVSPERVAWLDEAIRRHNEGLAPLTEFILPGGTRGAALAHLARTTCRRAERAVVALHHSEPVGEPLRQYLNRLSDLCFVLARVLNKAAGHADALWRKPGGQPAEAPADTDG
ncbi:MAG TPA: cob(I)yrinic acid a,c-diamide adenosyltransferase [Burkholderiaceae bacterium]|nr:cob(I)yrinic acid a,c-diamide adenosyltransferase [Burkholderiaceae bacterium]